MADANPVRPVVDPDERPSPRGVPSPRAEPGNTMLGEPTLKHKDLYVRDNTMADPEEGQGPQRPIEIANRKSARKGA